jgi:transcriptional regulator of acetoin/glycerol metabolism
LAICHIQTATDRDEQVAFAEASTIEHCDSLYSHLFEHANDARLQTTILCLLKLEFAKHLAQYGLDIAPDSMLADLLQVCEAVEVLLEEEPRVIFMQSPVYVIGDIHGNLAGVLNLSSEGRAFHFDAATVVGLYATSIENRLLLSKSRDYLVVRFQISPTLLDTPMAGLMGVDMQGKIVWKNAVAARLLGTLAGDAQTAALAVDDVLQSSFAKLASLRLRDPALLRLSNGLQVHARCQWPAHDMRYPVLPLGLPTPAAVAQDTRLEAAPGQRSDTATDANPTSSEPTEPGEPASLRDADADLIAKTLKGCAGNVSAAARKLRVSRGLIYRRTQRA